MPDPAWKNPRALRKALLPIPVILGLGWYLFASGDLVSDPVNVVLISIDTCRADHLGCYGGGPETTPHIDGVARDGVRFARAYSTNPITLPAHSSMLTGTNPLIHGVHNNHSYRLAESSVTLAELLKEQGLQTAAFVSSLIMKARFGLDQGFDVYDDEIAAAGDGIDERRGERTSEAAVRWLESHGRRPFFLFLHYFDPHAPHLPPEPHASRYPDSPYTGEIAYVDECIGQVIRKLESMRLYDSTLILITADHGEALGDHGEATHSFFVYDGTIRVPLVIKSPGGARSTVVDEPVGIVDIVPTVLGLLEVPAPPHLDGVDLSAWVMGRGRALERDLYCESLVPMEYGCSPLRGLIRGDWKYIWTARSELYDVAEDPGERHDRVAAMPALADAMRTRLRGMLSEAARTEAVDNTQDLDLQSLERLRALGYAGGTSAAVSPGSLPSGEDPKDFIDVLNRLLRANDLRARGQLAAARRMCLEILRDRPGNLRALQLLGDVSLLEGDYESAVDSYSTYLTGVTAAANAGSRGGGPGSGLRRDADLAEVHYNLASSLHRLQRLAGAAGHFEQAIQLREDLAPAHNGLGAVLAEQGRIPESIEHFRRALAIDPGLRSARENWIRAAEALERSDRDRAGTAPAPRASSRSPTGR